MLGPCCCHRPSFLCYQIQLRFKMLNQFLCSNSIQLSLLFALSGGCGAQPCAENIKNSNKTQEFISAIWCCMLFLECRPLNGVLFYLSSISKPVQVMVQSGLDKFNTILHTAEDNIQS